MVMSWEQRRSNCVLTGILHTENVSMAWALGFRNLMLPGPVLPVSGMPFDHARNSIVQHCLQGGYEYLFFLDSDVIPPRDVVHRLMAHRLPVVSGIYYRRSPPHGIPVMIKNGKWITEFPANALLEVDLVGAGLMLVHRTVFERVPPQQPGRPWFNWKVDLKGVLPEGECLSEDFTWNLHIRRHGVPVVVDTSIQARHAGYGQALAGRMEPLEATPNT